QGPTFRVTVPKFPTKDPNYRILARQRSRFTHYYFYIRDETLGPMVMRVASLCAMRWILRHAETTRRGANRWPRCSVCAQPVFEPAAGPDASQPLTLLASGMSSRCTS
ncbi:MAG TPA: hypothetical protein VKI44_12725, partial [Acetobacteraceae bacterium]|nr:hypothetical protein [Acetobacteraceae bacterium]